ncbi:hypothetical protein M3Y96_00670800 [Aphelenchoides besseyi]|nr:hypothetical protein M3Y96_00670800 [Aphelenchoides besseyi]
MLAVTVTAVCWSESCWSKLGTSEQHKRCNNVSPDHELVNVKLQEIVNKIDLFHQNQREDGHFWSKVLLALGALGIGFLVGVCYSNWKASSKSQLGFLARIANMATP